MLNVHPVPDLVRIERNEMNWTSPENYATPLPRNSALSAVLRSPSDVELQDILAAFTPAHAHYDELAFLRMLQGWLENRGLAMSYNLKDSALKARRQMRNRTMNPGRT